MGKEPSGGRKKFPEASKNGQKQTAWPGKIARCAQSASHEGEDAELPAADAQGKPQIRRKHAQREPEVERMRQPARPAAQAAQQIVMQAECRPEGGGQQELPGLQQQRLLHSAQQA